MNISIDRMTQWLQCTSRQLESDDGSLAPPSLTGGKYTLGLPNPTSTSLAQIRTSHSHVDRHTRDFGALVCTTTTTIPAPPPAGSTSPCSSLLCLQRFSEVAVVPLRVCGVQTLDSGMPRRQSSCMAFRRSTSVERLVPLYRTLRFWESSTV